MNDKAQKRIMELMKNIYEDYTELDGLLSSLLVNDSKEKKEKKESIPFGIICEVCSKEIMPVDVELRGQPRHFDAEQIAWFSQKEHQKNICWSCQHDTGDNEK